jgi:hypothetical protein
MHVYNKFTEIILDSLYPWAILKEKGSFGVKKMYNVNDVIGDIAYTGHLFEERIESIESAIHSYDTYFIIKNELNSIKEAYDRGCYLQDPHFPGEE